MPGNKVRRLDSRGKGRKRSAEVNKRKHGLQRTIGGLETGLANTQSRVEEIVSMLTRADERSANYRKDMRTQIGTLDNKVDPINTRLESLEFTVKANEAILVGMSGKVDQHERTLKTYAEGLQQVRFFVRVGRWTSRAVVFLLAVALFMWHEQLRPLLMFIKGWRIFIAAFVLVASTLVLSTAGRSEMGIASWYHEPQPTASGERFNPNADTCAHRKLPFNTRVKVTDLSSGRSTTCRINDRGPFIRGRIIDVSRKGATDLGIRSRGVARVSVEVIK